MNRRTLAIARATGVIGATVALVTGITFAQLGSNTVTLTNTTINSATASLKIWDGSTFTTTANGFTITGLVPGQGSPNEPVYFKNDGGVDLNLTTTVTNTPALNNINSAADVKVKITNDDTGQIKNTTLAALEAGNVVMPGNPLPAGAQGDSNNLVTPGNYHFNFDISPAAVSGSNASVGAFDFAFTGTQP